MARLFLDGIAGLQMIFQGNFNNALSVIKAHGYIYGNFGKILAKRKASKELINKHKIGAKNKAGMYRGIIVWDFFLFKKKKFNQLKSK